MKRDNDNMNSTKCTQLLETAKELFFKHGIKRVTIEEICEKANTSKVTFYKYFPNKNAIAEFIRDELLEEGFAKFDEINELDISYPEKINRMTYWRIEFFSRMSSEFIEEVLVLEDIQLEIKNRYLKNIQSAQEKGEIRKELSPELIWLVTEKINEIVKEGSWKQIFNDYRDFESQMRKMYFYGLLVE